MNTIRKDCIFQVGPDLPDMSMKVCHLSGYIFSLCILYSFYITVIYCTLVIYIFVEKNHIHSHPEMSVVNFL